jgi:hypothetical protein
LLLSCVQTFSLAMWVCGEYLRVSIFRSLMREIKHTQTHNHQQQIRQQHCVQRNQCAE